MTCNRETDLAVIGMSCYFPGARNYEQFWSLLIEGKNAIQEIPKDRWDPAQHYSPSLTVPNKSISKWAGILDDIWGFDNKFFHILPQEAKNMDPQIRLLLQEVWHCIEDAAVTPSELQKAITSVMIGIFSLDHLLRMPRAEFTEAYACTGNYACMAANRISHFFNWKGASFSLDAACASSFVVLQAAQNALRQGTCDYVVAGAANVICHPWHHISFSKCHVLSPDGQCKTFDQNANGYVRGEGVAVLLLTQKKRAIERGHRIHALIRGCAVNHCGKKNSVSTPSVDAQREVIEAAFRDSGVAPGQIDYIEAHGTGTALGDAIECAALKQAFGKRRIKIASVKTNIGHLETAAGFAGLIKAILMLQHQVIPRHLNLINPNPLIDFECLEIPEDNLSTQLAFAGISSMGFGGVNSHVIVEKWNNIHKRSSVLFSPILLSAKSAISLEKQLTEWSFFVGKPSFQTLSNSEISKTLLTGRAHLPFRRGFSSQEMGSKDFFSEKHKFSGSSDPLLYLQPLSSSSFPEIEPLLVFTTNQSLFSSWMESSRGRSLLSTYLLGNFLIQMGLKPSLLMGEGIGYIAALLLAESITLNDANVLLFSETNTFMAKKPIFPLFDPIANERLTSLISDFPHDEFVKNVSKIILLFENLRARVITLSSSIFAMKKIVESIERQLSRFELSLNSKPQRANDVALLNFAFLYALSELDQKYYLSQEIESESAFLNRCLTLLRKKLLDFPAVLNLIDDPYSLPTVNPQILDGIIVTLFPDQIYENSQRIFDEHKIVDFKYIDTDKGVCRVDSFKESLKILTVIWEKGAEIRWDLYASHFLRGVTSCSLPNYVFETTTFSLEA